MRDILQVMFDDGFLSATELVALRKTSRELRENPVRLMRSLNVASPIEIQTYFSRFLGFSSVEDDKLEKIDIENKKIIPADIAKFFSVFALGKRGNRVVIAMEDPSDKNLTHQIEFFLGQKIVGLCATVNQLAFGLQRLYGFKQNDMKLTTVLEQSRGIQVGKLHYENAGIELPELLNIKDEASQEMFRAPSSTIYPHLDEQPAHEVALAAGFADLDLDEPVGFAEAAKAENLMPDESEPSTPSMSEGLAEGETVADLSLDFPATEGGDDLLALQTPDEALISALEETSVEESVQPPKTAATLSPEYLVQLTNAINGSLVKLSMIKNKEQAVTFLNEKLALLDSHVELLEKDLFQITCKEEKFTAKAGEMGETSQVKELFAPLVKKLSKIA